MVQLNIATSAEQPINRDAAVSKVAAESEGTFVGLDSDGELVQADAAAGVLAIGLMAAPVKDLADYSNEVVAVRSTVESEYNLVGEDKIPFIWTGIEVVDSDNELALTPGQPVYLAEGGGVTQTKPSASGDIVQRVGIAGADGVTILLDVEWGAETVA